MERKEDGYYVIQPGLTAELHLGSRPAHDQVVLYGLDNDGRVVHLLISPTVWIEIAALCRRHFPSTADTLDGDVWQTSEESIGTE